MSRTVNRKPKFALGQFVKLKPGVNSSFASGFTGLIVAYTGFCEGTEQGYGILVRGCGVVDFREEELAPVITFDSLVENTLDAYYELIRDPVDLIWELTQYPKTIEFDL